MNILDNFFGRKKNHPSTLGPPPETEIVSKKSPDHAYRPGDFINGRYEVVTILTGGMAVVYLCADHERQQRPLALKTFKQKYLSSRRIRDRFLREGTIWVKLAHPNIVRAYKVERVGDGREVYLVLEWVAAAEGKEDASLRGWLEPGKPLQLDQALLFALQIARGMRYATTEIPNLVHRDLKPENVLVGRDGNTRVTDFGLASMFAGIHRGNVDTGVLKRNFRRTMLSHGLVGTPLYMAPEQWRKDSLIDVRTDIYAFGCILYEMMVGQPAVPGSTLEDLARAHCAGEIRDIPAHLPQDVQTLILHCLALNQADRYQDWWDVEVPVRSAYERVSGSVAPIEISIQDKDAQVIRTELVSTAWSYHAMGLSYYDIGHYDQAGGYFERVVWVGEQEQERRLEAAGLNRLGNVCRALSDVDSALRYHKRQLKLARMIDDRAEETDAIGNLGNDYAKLGDIDRAIVHFKQQIGLAREIKDLSREGLALRNLGDASREMDRPKESLKFYEYALIVAKKDKDRVMEGRILSSIGVAYGQLGDTKRAVKYYSQAVKIAEQIGDRTGIGNGLGYLGIAYRTLGDTDKAVMYLMKCLAITRDAGLKFEEGRVLSKLGTIYFEEGDATQALDFFETCLVIVRELGDLFWLGNVLEQVGDCYRELGSRDQAIGYYEERLSVAKSTGKPIQIAKALHTLGNGYRNFRDAPRAHPYYQDALKIADQLGDESLFANVSLDFALLLHWHGDRDEAMRYSEAALQLLKELNDKERMKEARHVISFIKKQKRWP